MNELVPSGGGAIVPVTSTGGAVGEYVGDISFDRGLPTVGVDRPAGVSAGHHVIVSELLSQLNLTESQKQITHAWLARNIGRLEQLREEAALDERLALDKREQTESTAAMRGKWGADYEKNVRKITEWLIDTFGEDTKEELYRARDFEGKALFNKPEVLEALLEAARATLTSDDKADRAVAIESMRAEWRGHYDVSVDLIRRYIDSLPQVVQHGLYWARDELGVLLINRPAGLRWLLQMATRRPANGGGGPSVDLSARRRELEGWMSNRDARYWKDEAAQVEYRGLLDQGVRADVVPHTADSEVERRIAEIEKWMGARKGSTEYKRYWDDAATQREYGELLERREHAQHNRRS